MTTQTVWTSVSVLSGMLLLFFLTIWFVRRTERRRLAQELEAAAKKVRTLRPAKPAAGSAADNMSDPDGMTVPDEVRTYPAPPEVERLVDAAQETFDQLRDQYEITEGEAARNRVLAAEISRFYSHVRVLNGRDFRIDFFEYQPLGGHLLFLTGLATLFGEGSQIFREMSDVEFFSRFACSFDDREEASACEAGMAPGAEQVHRRFRRAAQESLRTGEPFQMEFRACSEEDGYLWLRCWGRPDGPAGKINGALTDISREIGQREADRNRFLSDGITGFHNRNALAEVGGRVLDARKPGETVAFIYFGLSRYAEFEARFGMVTGNSYIRAFADLLREHTDPRMSLFRWWGPDFLCIVHDTLSETRLEEDGRNLLAHVAGQRRTVGGISTDFPLTAGYAVAGIHGETPAELLEHAAFAKHEADTGLGPGFNPFHRSRYDASRQVSLRRSFIRDVIDRNELYVVYQPIVSLKTGELHGFEALSRPANRMYRSISELIGDAEDSGHYAILEKRMVYNALDGFMERPEQFRDAWLFINTAPVPVLTAQDYQDIRDRYFSFMRVVYEVIERNRIEPEEMARRKALVRETGARFALDDFGSGYSNHLALLALEPDIIKIDRGLVHEVDRDVRKQHMLEDIIGYACQGGTRVLAEGVETRGELEAVCRIGVDYAQGYYLGRPAVSFEAPSGEAVSVIRSMSREQAPTPAHAVDIALRVFALREPALARHALLTGWFCLRLGEQAGMEAEDALRFSLAGVLLDAGVVLSDECDWRSLEGRDAVPRAHAAAGLTEAFLPDWPHAAALRRRHGMEREGLETAQLLQLADRLALQAEAGSVPLRAERFQRAAEMLAMPRGMAQEQLLPLLAEEAGDTQLRENWLKRLAQLPSESSLTEGLIRLIACAVDARSPHLSGHAAEMEKLAEMLSHMRKLGWQTAERIRLAALCGDLGNLSVPASLFDRQGRLNASEMALIRAHAERTRLLLTRVGLSELAELQVRATEAGVAAERPVEKDVVQGRAILAVADILSALLQDRAWRPALTRAQASAVLTDMANAGMLDPLVADTAVENLEVLADALQAVRRLVQDQLRMATVRLHVVSGGVSEERLSGGSPLHEL